jgi:putative endonuclease
MPSLRAIGNSGEHFAVSFLKQLGMVVLDRNYTYNHGEIDIVARDGSELVFVEVKMRRSARFGMPEESVTPSKQALVRRTAEGYVQEKNLDEISCRFDVIAIRMEHGRRKLVYYKNAF